jgi:hypothetical protein
MFWLQVLKFKRVTFAFGLAAMLCTAVFNLSAQDLPAHDKGSYIDSAGNYYQQAELPLYIYVSHKPDAPPHHLKEDKGSTTEPIAKPIYLDGHGKHLLKHTDGINHTAQVFAVFADGVAPVSKVSLINAPIFKGKNGIFYGQGLESVISSKDEMSGVSAVYQSLNQSAFALYEKKSYASEGAYSLAIYAIDRVGNTEKIQKSDFFVDLPPPATYHNIVGIAEGNIISSSTKLYLTHEDSASGVSKTYYRLDEGNYNLYFNGSNINFASLNDGEHTLTYYSIDQVNNKEEEKSFTFYYDKTAPIMSADVLGDRFVVNEKVYFSGRTKLKLTAVDNKSGIKNVLYSVNGDEFRDYNDPFYLPSRAGEHVIKYYAVDKMSNEGTGNKSARLDEYRHNVSKVYLDLTGPILSHEFKGKIFKKGDSVFISKRTNINLKAHDPESGLQYISYNFAQDGEEKKFETSFQLEEPGIKNIYFYGYDNVNNRNMSNFVVVVDNDAPVISNIFSISPVKEDEKMPVYPSYVTLFLAASDEQVGLSDLRYKINEGKEMPYSGFIQGFKPKQTYSITVFSTDMLGNKSEKTFKFKTDKY